MALKKELYYSMFREKITHVRPYGIRKQLNTRADVIKITDSTKGTNFFRIEYEDAKSKDLHRVTSPSDTEIEAYCSGVDAERERFLNVLSSTCDKGTIQRILDYQEYSLKRSLEKKDIRYGLLNGVK